MGFAYNQPNTLITVGEATVLPLTSSVTKKRTIVELTTYDDTQAELQSTTDSGANFALVSAWQVNNTTVNKNFGEQTGQLRLTLLSNLTSGSSTASAVMILAKTQKKEAKNSDVEIC